VCVCDFVCVHERVCVCVVVVIVVVVCVFVCSLSFILIFACSTVPLLVLKQKMSPYLVHVCNLFLSDRRKYFFLQTFTRDTSLFAIGSFFFTCTKFSPKD